MTTGAMNLSATSLVAHSSTIVAKQFHKQNARACAAFILVSKLLRLFLLVLLLCAAFHDAMLTWC